MTFRPPEAPHKVLIIKPSALGDIVGALPVLHGLRRTFPQIHIAWLAAPAFAGILQGQPNLNEIILFDRKHFGRIGRSPRATVDFIAFCRDLRRRRFDWAIDLQGLFRSGFLARVSGARMRLAFRDCREQIARVFYTHALAVDPAAHAIDRNLQLVRLVGVDARPEDLHMSVSPPARQHVEGLLAQYGLTRKQFAVLSAGTTWPNKHYPVRHWKAVVSGLSDVALVLTGVPKDAALCAELTAAGRGKVVNLAGQTDVPELAALIEAAAVTVSPDSAPNFIGPAVGTPSVALLGPTRSQYIGPYLGFGRALTADIPCLGCRKRTCSHTTCMQWLEPDRVIHAIRELTRNSPPKA